MENTKDRATIIVNGEVVKKFEENGEKNNSVRHHCSRCFGQQKALGIFYCGPALISFLYQVAFKN